MKNFMEGVMEWKSAAALIFSASVLVSIIVMLFNGQDSVQIPVLLSMLIISCAGTFFQYLAFSNRIIKKMRYTLRMVVFAVPFFALLAGNAWFFNWFPVEDTMHWLVFTGIYLVVFIGSITAFEIYFHVIGKKYDGLLGQYRKQRDLK